LRPQGKISHGRVVEGGIAAATDVGVLKETGVGEKRRPCGTPEVQCRPPAALADGSQR
jgi:hypothetical protein